MEIPCLITFLYTFAGMRLRLDLQYDGTGFFGWQIQPDVISVQGTIEDVLTRLNSGNPVEVMGCGRTDTGVHAFHYVAHCDFSFKGNLTDLKWKMNTMLPSSIAILSIESAEEHFHARFDARFRTYRYFIHQVKSPFEKSFSYYYPHTLDVEAMNKACSFIIGQKDFTSFSKLHTDVKTNDCEVTGAMWVKEGNKIYFEITANRFLRNMVRAVVGTLLLVGEGKISPEEVAAIIERKDRGEAGRSVPGCGLFLWRIEY